MSNVNLGAVADTLDGSSVEWEQRLDVESLENLVEMLGRELNVRMVPGPTFSYNEAKQEFIYNRDLLLKLPAAAGAGLTFHNMGHARLSGIDKKVFNDLRSRTLQDICNAIAYHSGGKIPAASVFQMLEAAEDERMENQVRKEYPNLENTYLPRHDKGWRRESFLQKFQAMVTPSSPGQTDQNGNPVYWNRVATALRGIVSGSITKDLLPEDIAWPQEFCDKLASLRNEKSAGDVIRKLHSLVPEMVKYREDQQQPPSDGEGEGEGEESTDGMDDTNTGRSDENKKKDKDKKNEQDKDSEEQDSDDNEGDDESESDDGDNGDSGSPEDTDDDETDSDSDGDSGGSSDSNPNDEDESDDSDSSGGGGSDSESDDSDDEDDDGGESGDESDDPDNDDNGDDEGDDTDPELEKIKEEAEKNAPTATAPPTPKDIADEKREAKADFDLMNGGTGAGFGIDEEDKTTYAWAGPAWSLVRKSVSNIKSPVQKAIRQELKDNEIEDKERGHRRGRFDSVGYVQQSLAGGRNFYSQFTGTGDKHYAVYFLVDKSGSMDTVQPGLIDVPELRFSRARDSMVDYHERSIKMYREQGLRDEAKIHEEQLDKYLDQLNNKSVGELQQQTLGQTRYQFAARMVVTFIESLVRFPAVKTGVGTFGDVFRPLKELNQSLTGEVKQKIMDTIFNPNEGTTLTYALRDVITRLNKVQANGKMIFILTDGGFCEPTEFASILNKAKASGIEVVCFTVGCSTSSAEKYLPKENCAQLTDNNVGKELGKHLRRMVKGVK